MNNMKAVLTYYGILALVSFTLGHRSMCNNKSYNNMQLLLKL